MPSKKNQQKKSRLHYRNKNREQYDLSALKTSSPELKNYIIPNKFGVKPVDFSSPLAVKILNKAILNHYYGIKNWEFPDENLCPPIPGRVDYIHYVSDLLSDSKILDKISVLDIGTGATCIYPLLGVKEYDWNFIATDIELDSLDTAQDIIDDNNLSDKIILRQQFNEENILEGIIEEISKNGELQVLKKYEK